MSKLLLCSRHVSKTFSCRGLQSKKRAVDDVSLDLYEGETFGLVGESGCGKSTLAHILLGIIRPSSGEVLFDGQNVLDAFYGRNKEMRRQMQIVFQDPCLSLDPRIKIGDSVCEGLDIFRKDLPKAQRRKMTLQMLQKVGLDSGYADMYPLQLSGGLLQRVLIAQALIVGHKFVVCDEPVSSLDMSVQAQIINLLKDVQEHYGMTYLFISHNINVVFFMSDRIGVMYFGRIVEIGPASDVVKRPLHPYTAALVSGEVLPYDASVKEDAQSGCAFCGKCKFCKEKCREERPVLKQLSKGRMCSCHFPLQQTMSLS